MSLSITRAKASGRGRAIGLLLLATGCTGAEAPPERPVTAAVSPQGITTGESSSSERTRAFDAGRAWQHLELITAMGPRLDGHPGHVKFRAWVRRELEALGWTVTEQPFTYQVPGEEKVYRLANVSALLGPRSAETLLLGTHYDTRPWSDEERDPDLRRQPVPGANDGGSGVAVLLEIARVLSERPPSHGVEILLFDGEDLGRSGHPEEYSQGAQHLVSNWASITEGAPFPATVVVVDMVGDSDLRIPPEAASLRAYPELTRRLWAAARRLGYGEVFPDGPARGVWDDHRPFLDAGVPSALIIDLDYPHWHTVRDTIDKCSPESLEIVGRVVLEALFGE